MLALADDGMWVHCNSTMCLAHSLLVCKRYKHAAGGAEWTTTHSGKVLSLGPVGHAPAPRQVLPSMSHGEGGGGSGEKRVRVDLEEWVVDSNMSTENCAKRVQLGHTSSQPAKMPPKPPVRQPTIHPLLRCNVVMMRTRAHNFLSALAPRAIAGVQAVLPPGALAESEWSFAVL
jgi:hypothetical protein